MRSIPNDLLAKIKNAWQAAGNNTDPKMDIIAQKVTKYLTEGTFLNPRTIRTGNDLGPLDIAIRREDVNADPTEIVMAYIENGQAKVATLPYVHTPDQNFVYRYTIGPATDVAIDFDGRWHRITDRTGIYFETNIIWALVTFGEPYIARVNNGQLLIQQGQGSSITLADSGVTKCSLLRAWKNTYLWNHDQGIIAAYIKDGVVCYRNYAQQPPDQPALWELEREVTELPTPAQNVSLFRTNDYRTAFMCESNGQMHWTITARNWANMAIEPHYVSAGITDVMVDFIPILETNWHLEHRISASVSDVGVNFCPIEDPQVIDATVEDNSTVLLEFDMPLMEGIGQENAFIITDDMGTPFNVISTELGGTAYFLVLHTESLIGAVSNLNIQFRPIQNQVQVGMLRSQLTPNCIKQLTDFDIQASLAPPEGYSDHNVSVGITDVSASFIPIVYTNRYIPHSVSAAITDVTVNFIHVDDINP